MLGNALAAVAILAAGVVALPSSATAATYTPPVTPVEVLPDLPSEWASKLPTITDEQLAIERARIQTGGMSAAEKASFSANGVLSKMTPLQRGNTVLLAGSAGFALGAGGIRLVYAATGQDWDKTMCDLPEVIREGYAVFSFGAGSSTCPQPVVHPNSDQDVEFGDLALAGATTLSYKGWFKAANGNRFDCYGLSPVELPSSHKSNVTLRDSAGTVYGGGGYDGSQISGCPSGSYFSWSPPPLRWVSSTGGVLASMSEQTADPARQYRVATRAPGGGSYTGRCAPVTAKDSEGLPLGGLGASCSGVTMDPAAPPEAVGIQEYNPATSTWDTVLDSPLDAAQQQRLEDYPDCYDGSQQCTLVLRAAQGTTTTACLTAGNGACAGWWADTAQGTQPTTATGREYKCSYGPYTVDLERCSVYRQAFDIDTATGTQTGTKTDPGGEPIREGESSTSPNSTIPLPVGGAGGSCMDTWGDDFNPIDWVLTPVKCALQWAFVPRAEVVAQTQTAMAEAWEPTIMGRLPGVVSMALVIPDGGSGCTGPLVQIPIHFGGADADYEGYPLSACDEPMSTLAGWARLIGSALLIWWTGLGIIRRGSAVVNAPGVGGAS